jgi:Xaa-Pro aminopeptidase
METLRESAPSLSWLFTKKVVEQLRTIKDAGEIAQIREAVRYAEKAYAMFRAMLEDTDTEKGLADAMDGFLRRAGATGSSFSTIVGVGDHSAQPHAPISTRRVSESPFLLLDWGASGKFYKSDITRMIWYGAGEAGKSGGGVEDRLRKLYTIVLEAQTRALDAVRPGVTAGAVDAAVRAYLEQHGYNQYFNHGLGHGIGLQIHEGPNIRGQSPDVLQSGMVFTLEPGVYLPEFAGVRIEDDFLLTENGPEPLTHLPKQPDEVFRV